MKHREIPIGGSVFMMPPISMGSGCFGFKVDRPTAYDLLDYYTAQGGTWLDTARVYGPSILPPADRRPEHEDSELIIGDWLRSRGGRDRYTIITKGCHFSWDTGEKRVSAKCIREDAEKSLKTLGIPYVDIYFLHNDDESVPVSEVMPTLHELVKSGKTRVIGASNWSAQRIAEANAFAIENGLTPFAISQVRWSYLVPINLRLEGNYNMETDPSQYELYQKMQMPVMAFSSQSRGFFIKTAKYGFDPEKIGRANIFLSEENIRRSKVVKELAESEGVSVASINFAYLWGKKIPVTALVGCYTIDQLKESLLDHDYVPGPGVLEALENARFVEEV